MLYKELTFLKNDIKRYLLVLVLLAVVIGYFIYKKIDITILMFLSFSLPGLLVSLQTAPQGNGFVHSKRYRNLYLQRSSRNFHQYQRYNSN